MVSDRFVVSDGFEIVGSKGDRGEQGDMGPRGLQGQPGKSGDNYFTYYENRNLSYNKGGIAIGKEAEISGSEILHIGSKAMQQSRVIYEGDEIVIDYKTCEEVIRQTIKNNTIYWENGNINFMNRMTIEEEKICEEYYKDKLNRVIL